MPYKNREDRLAYNAQYYIKNRATDKKNRAAKYAANPLPIRARNAAWRLAHLASERAKEAEYYQEHREERSQYESLYRKRRPEVYAAANKKHHATKMNAPVNDFTAAQWQEMKAAYGHRCVYCGRKMQRLTQDHITPLSKGGSHTSSNIVPACQSCNSKKNTGEAKIMIQPLLLTIAPSQKKKAS